MNTSTRFGAILILSAAAAAAYGCSTESYCWNCGDAEAPNQDGGGGQGGTGMGGQGGTVCVTDCGAAGTIMAGAGGSKTDACSPNAKEECDGIDNNCNGAVDEGFELQTDPKNCGVCALVDPAGDCYQKVQNAEKPTCVAGVCGYTNCVSDYWDLDGNKANGCEAYCVLSGNNDLTCDGTDNDCNGKVDDGVNKCTDATNCGKCGRNCQGHPHAIGKCQTANPPPASCDESNTQCVLDHCEAGWIDANNNLLDGCEYACVPKKRANPADPASGLVDCQLSDADCGIEYCDGVDNDCNGYIDNADPNLVNPLKGDPEMNKDCHGSQLGECGQPSHKGISRCVNAAIKCVDDNTGGQDCTNNAAVCTGDTPFCIPGPTPPSKVCGTKVLKMGDQPELCNLKDDDCDGNVDGATSDAGGYCGKNLGICVQGKYTCQNGALVCSGALDPQNETCNGADDDCDGVIDGTLPGAAQTCTTDADCSGVPGAHFCLVRSGATDKVCAALAADIQDGNGNPMGCDVPLPAPAGWTTPCKAGALTCVGGAKVCLGSVKAQTSKDACGQDLNCDGVKSPDYDTSSDPLNCGSCGHDCSSGGGHVQWTCVGGVCTVPTVNKCQSGFIDCDSNANDCERACTFYSTQEVCNGVDDNCDCATDEMKDGAHPNGITAPSATQVCGVSTAATGACLTTQVVCSAGKWSCNYPAGYCNGGTPPSCAATPDVCDGKDNNCNGNTDENFKLPVLTQGYIGQACASDDNVTPKHGLCQQTGTFQCDGTSATACVNSSNQKIAGVKLACGTGSGQSGHACDEACDGEDNDCDGLVDETYSNKGTNATYWVKPAVISIGTNLYMYQYEASRPSASATNSGYGNGWWRNASMLTNQPTPPAGTILDKTPACSKSGVIPWFNVTGSEAQHVCREMGGRLCRNGEWTTACRSNSGTTCNWSFDTNCTTFSSTGTNSTTCNLYPYDFDTVVAGNQDGLLATGALAGCHANWTGGGIFDLTGNLRELTCGGTTNCTAAQTSFILMGGAFNTNDPTGTGASCSYKYYNVTQTFKLFDVGFRCCFDANPS